MARINLPEIEDFEWCPEVIRNSTTDFLRTYIMLFNVYKPIYPKITELLSKCNHTRIIDLCSGGGGPMINLVRYLAQNPRQQSTKLQIVLTDLYPNKEAFEYVIKHTEDHAQVSSETVDATNVPLHLKGIRTLFTSFHHFDEDKAKKIIQDAVQAEAPIGIFEMTERSMIAIILMAVIGLVISFILIPLSPPLSAKKLLAWPVSSLVTWWDGIASCFRSHSLKALKKLVAKIDAPHYHWEIGKKFSWTGGCNITYLIGYPIA